MHGFYRSTQGIVYAAWPIIRGDALELVGDSSNCGSSLVPSLSWFFRINTWVVFPDMLVDVEL